MKRKPFSNIATPSASQTLEEEGAFSIEEFCVWAGIGRSAAYEEINDGRLVARKRGSRTLIPRAAARRWLENLPLLKSRAAEVAA
jgi:hypothetical protein